MTDGSLIHRLVCKKTSLSTFFEQFLVVLNLKYLHRIQCSENGRLTTAPQHPIPAFCSDHTRTRLTTAGVWNSVGRLLCSESQLSRAIRNKSTHLDVRYRSSTVAPEE